MDGNGTELREGIKVNCLWSDDWEFSNSNGTSCVWKYCHTTPWPPAGSNLVIVNQDEHPLSVGKNWTYKCKEGMKFEDDVGQDTFQVECIAGDNSSDAVVDKWPICQPASTCSGLPSPGPSGATASLLYRGETFGRCLGLPGLESPPSCSDGVEVLLETSSKLSKDTSMRRQPYIFRPKNDGDIHYLVTFSYQQQHLDNVRRKIKSRRVEGDLGLGFDLGLF